MSKSKTIRIRYHSEPEGCWADSPDIPGFTAAGSTLDEVREQVRGSLPHLLREPLEIVEEEWRRAKSPAFEPDQELITHLEKPQGSDQK